MKSPATRLRFIGLAAAVWLLMFVAELAADVLYFPLSHDPLSDSPGVAIMQLQAFAVSVAIFAPVFIFFVWFIWRRYSGAQPLFIFSRTQPVMSSLLWLVFGGLAVLCLVSLLFVRRLSDLPWALHGVLTTYFLLSCNASLFATYASHAEA